MTRQGVPTVDDQITAGLNEERQSARIPNSLQVRALAEHIRPRVAESSVNVDLLLDLIHFRLSEFMLRIGGVAVQSDQNLLGLFIAAFQYQPPYHRQASAATQGALHDDTLTRRFRHPDQRKKTE